jgi:hypothetical protein
VLFQPWIAYLEPESRKQGDVLILGTHAGA